MVGQDQYVAAFLTRLEATQTNTLSGTRLVDTTGTEHVGRRLNLTNKMNEVCKHKMWNTQKSILRTKQSFQWRFLSCVSLCDLPVYTTPISFALIKYSEQRNSFAFQSCFPFFVSSFLSNEIQYFSAAQTGYVDNHHGYGISLSLGTHLILFLAPFGSSVSL